MSRKPFGRSLDGGHVADGIDPDKRARGRLRVLQDVVGLRFVGLLRGLAQPHLVRQQPNPRRDHQGHRNDDAPQPGRHGGRGADSA